MTNPNDGKAMMPAGAVEEAMKRAKAWFYVYDEGVYADEHVRAADLDRTAIAVLEALAERNEYLETVLDCTGGTMVQAIFRERDALKAEIAQWKPLIEATTELILEAAELLEVATLRGDTDLPHPADDQKLWTARMQTAWDGLRAALKCREKAIPERDK